MIYFLSVAVFVCIRSYEEFKSSCRDILSGCFKGWTDINSLTMARFDPTYLKFIASKPGRLSGLAWEHQAEQLGTEVVREPEELDAALINRILSGLQPPEKQVNFVQLPSSEYLVLVIHVGLVTVRKLSEARSVLGSLGLKGEKVDWNCGLDPAVHTGTVDASSASV